MEKRYQVFVSSTYVDLQEERRQVTQAPMKMDCIPAGMELFPAFDEEQWKFIQRVIDDCDYYLLIIGGRYGTPTDEGISFTEREFDYAVSKGLRVLAFLHGEPGKIAAEKSERDPASIKKLEDFRNKVSTGRLVNFWTSASDLPAMVVMSLLQTIKIYPAVGWVRANQVASGDALSDLNTIRKENDELRKKIAISESTPHGDLNLASLDEEYAFTVEWYDTYKSGAKEVTTTWRNVFSTIAPMLSQAPRNSDVNSRMANELYGSAGPAHRCNINQYDFETIRTQLIALGLISIEVVNHSPRWGITQAGERLLLETRTIKAKGKDQSPQAS